MMFSNILLVFMISLQFGMYGLMIDNTLQAFTGHLQIQAPGYIDDQKMRQTVPDIVPLANSLRAEFPAQNIAARASGFAAWMKSNATSVTSMDPSPLGEK